MEIINRIGYYMAVAVTMAVLGLVVYVFASDLWEDGSRKARNLEEEQIDCPAGFEVAVDINTFEQHCAPE